VEGCLPLISGLDAYVIETPADIQFCEISGSAERGKRDFDCDKQVEKAVTAPNCVLKGL